MTVPVDPRHPFPVAKIVPARPPPAEQSSPVDPSRSPGPAGGTTSQGAGSLGASRRFRRCPGSTRADSGLLRGSGLFRGNGALWTLRSRSAPVDLGTLVSRRPVDGSAVEEDAAAPDSAALPS